MKIQNTCNLKLQIKYYNYLLISIVSLVCVVVNAQDLEIINVRVGQGDATLIKGPVDSVGNRINVLVDAGNISNRDGGNILRTVLKKRGVKRLDFVIVTHYDADHIGGIVSGGVHGTSLFLGFDEQPGGGDDIAIGQFVDRGDASPPSSQAYQKYKTFAEANTRISLDTKAKLEQFEIPLGNRAMAIALASNGFVREKDTQVNNVNTENERSMSFLVTYEEFDFLISGDLIGRGHGGENAAVEKEVGKYIANRNIVVDVLHANHHGANNGSETEFLEAIHPTIAVISAGNGNDYKHPHKNALKRLEAAGVYRIIQTSWGTTTGIMPEQVRQIQAIYQNDVVITSDGSEFTISTSRTYKTDDNPND